jgi:hypothetical protein
MVDCRAAQYCIRQTSVQDIKPNSGQTPRDG